MDLSRGQKALVLIGLAAILLALLVLSLNHAGQARGQTTVATAVPQLQPTAAPRLVAVHVVGAVNHPGVYWLSSGARVEEAVTQAGGFRGDADASSVNLAALVQDGQQVRVEYTAAPAEPAPPAAVPQPPATATAPAPAAAPETPPAKTATGRRLGPSLDLAHVRPVSLSTASQAQLEELPKIGPALAANIVHYRTQHGPFRSVDDLVNVPGFGDQRLEALRPYVMP